MDNRPAKNPRATVWKSLLLVVGIAMLFAPAGARAETLTADCGTAIATPPHYTTVTAALAAFVDSTVRNTLIINGTCHNESVPGLIDGIRIDGFSRLTVRAGGSGATLSHDSGLPCAPTAPFSNFSTIPVLTIVDSHQLIVEGFGTNAGGPGVNGGRLFITGGNGISIEDSSVTFRGVTIDNSRGSAIGVGNGSSVSLQGNRSNPPVNTENFLQNNCGPGVGTSPGSSANLSGWNTIQNNQGGGAGGNGRVSINAGLDSGGNQTTILIQNNQGPAGGANTGGFLSLGGNVIVQNNALNPDVTMYPAGMRAALVAYSQGIVFVNGQVQILNNQGPAIWADLQSVVRLGPPVIVPPPPPNLTVSGNTGGGLKLTHMSVAQSSSIAVMTGNTGSDASCDTSSLIYGDVTGISVMKCSNTEQTKK